MVQIFCISWPLIPCEITQDTGTLIFFQISGKFLWIFKVGIRMSVFCTLCHLGGAILSNSCFSVVQGVYRVFWLKWVHTDKWQWQGKARGEPALKGHKLANTPLKWIAGDWQAEGMGLIFSEAGSGFANQERACCYWSQRGRLRENLITQGLKLSLMLGQWYLPCITRENSVIEETQLVKRLIKLTVSDLPSVLERLQ